MHEAQKLGSYILGKIDRDEFDKSFLQRTSNDFNPDKDLKKIGIINQTTMLANETQEIADYFKKLMEQKYGSKNIKNHFADTRDTLCYATNENQQATLALLNQSADIAIVVGGYNSSNTSHLVELCEQKFPTYFISSEKEIISKTTINHFDFHNQKNITTSNYIPSQNIDASVNIILTCGASCPDALVEKVMMKILSYFENVKSKNEVLSNILSVG
jgi:4-hydroxy-3-methylbut-2-enyl diphosphate reductase